MFEKSFSFNGRIRRTEYGLSSIIYLIGVTILNVIISKTGNDIFGLSYIALIWFIWAQGSKRCHDLGNSGWYQIIPFYILWMFFQDSQPNTNEYGNNPKAHVTKRVVEPPIIIEKAPDAKIIPLIIENNKTILEISNSNYSLVQDIMKKLRNFKTVKSMSYDLLGTTSTITINHLDTNSLLLLDELYKVTDNIQVIHVEEGNISIKFK